MELKNIFKMTKTDRYTQDGRDELAKLQETEDVKYKTGDISQKTGLQKQPDGSWAPPKGGAGAKKAAESKKIDYQVTEKGGKFYATGHQFSDGSQLHAGPFGSEKELHEFMNGSPYKSTAESKPAAKKENQPKAKFDEYGLPDDETISMKDEFLKKENVADPNTLTNAEFNALAKKLDSELGIGNMELAQELLVTPRENPDYPFKPKTSEERAERAKFEKDRDDFIERMNKYREESKTQKDPKEIIATPGKLATQEQTDAATAIADKNSYSFETMMEKFPIQKIQQFANSKVDDFEGGIDEYIEFKAEGRTGVDMEEVGKDFAKLINHNVARRIWNGYTNGSLKVDEKGFFKPAASEEAPGSAESKAWADRSKNERTATLVDWLDDWDKHPEEKNDAAYAAIEKELASRGVNRAGRQDAKKADNAGRNEFYRRAYEGDAAPRQLTGDCRIRIRKEKPKLTGDTRIRVKK